MNLENLTLDSIKPIPEIMERRIVSGNEDGAVFILNKNSESLAITKLNSVYHKNKELFPSALLMTLLKFGVGETTVIAIVGFALMHDHEAAADFDDLNAFANHVYKMYGSLASSPYSKGVCGINVFTSEGEAAFTPLEYQYENSTFTGLSRDALSLSSKVDGAETQGELTVACKLAYKLKNITPEKIEALNSKNGKQLAIHVYNLVRAHAPGFNFINNEQVIKLHKELLNATRPMQELAQLNS